MKHFKFTGVKVFYVILKCEIKLKQILIFDIFIRSKTETTFQLNAVCKWLFYDSAELISSPIRD